MAYKTLIFGVDDMFGKLRQYYLQAVKINFLDIAAYAVFVNGKIRLFAPDGKPFVKQVPTFDLAIVSSKMDFYRRMKFLEKIGFPRNQIIDGRIFKVPHLNLPRLLKEGVAYGMLDKKNFKVNSHAIYPQAYTFTKGNNTTLIVGAKSYISDNACIEGKGAIAVKKFACISRDIIFSVGENWTHNYRNATNCGASNLDWHLPEEFYPPQGTCKILIGNDVWIGRGAILKSVNPDRPLVIGDGAVVASDSVVVKNVPPYAIVGGNPAKIIKYRFPPHVIESFLRIKWWDWSLDKIHDNFKYFNNVEKLISLHDRS